MMIFKKLSMYIVLAALIVMSACGTAAQNNGETTEPTNGQTTESQIDSQENNAFRNIKVTGEKGDYIVNGEARVFEGVFFYAVEDGHDYLIEETKIEVNQGAPTWEPFELKISIPQDQLPVNGTVTLTLYEYSAKDNSMTNIFNVKLEQIIP